jgi:hypothetical protein
MRPTATSASSNPPDPQGRGREGPQAAGRIRERLSTLELPVELHAGIADGSVPLSALKALVALAKIHPPAAADRPAPASAGRRTAGMSRCSGPTSPPIRWARSARSRTVTPSSCPPASTKPDAATRSSGSHSTSRPTRTWPRCVAHWTWSPNHTRARGMTRCVITSSTRRPLVTVRACSPC